MNERKELVSSTEVFVVLVGAVLETLPRHRRLTLFCIDEVADLVLDVRFSLSTKHVFRLLFVEVLRTEGDMVSLSGWRLARAVL